MCTGDSSVSRSQSVMLKIETGAYLSVNRIEDGTLWSW
jgi:hypothetical protein